MCEYSDLDGECKQSNDSYILTDCGDLFGWQHYLTDDLNKQYRRQLEPCGEYYGNDDLYLYTCCGTMREYGDLDGDGECPCYTYIQSDCGDLFRRFIHLTDDLNK